jgi:hypothetical protein
MGVQNVLFAGPVPRWKADLPKIIARQLWFSTPERTFVGLAIEYLDKNLALKSEFEKNSLNYLDLISVFCNENGCLTRIGDNRMTDLVTKDVGHLLPIASDYLAQRLLIPKILQISGRK